MNDKDNKEKRKHTRSSDYICIRTCKIPKALPPRELKGIGDSDVFLGTVLKSDISPGGMSHISENKYEVGDIIGIMMQCRGNNIGLDAVISGEVKWIRSLADNLYESGVEFLMLDEEFRNRLNKV